MGNVAFIFPGQAQMEPGAGQALIAQLPLVGSTVEETSEAVDRDLEAVCFHGTEEALNTADSVDSLIFALSLGLYRSFRVRGVTPDILGGFSLGEYPAFCASGAVSLTDTSILVEERSKLLSVNKDGAMARVKAGVEQVRQICDQFEGVGISAMVSPALTNILLTLEAAN